MEMRDKLGQYINGHPQSNTGRTHNFKKGFTPWNKNRINLVCIICKSDFTTSFSRVKNGQKCCSRKCADISHGKSIKGNKCCLYKHGLSRTREYQAVYNHKRRTLMDMAGKLTIETIQRTYENNIKKYGTLTCYLCLRPIEFGRDQLEHKQPLSRGGSNKYNNLAIACKSCNSGKRNKTVEEYKKGVVKI